MWKELPPIGCWQATHVKQDTCHVSFKALVIFCAPQEKGEREAVKFTVETNLSEFNSF